MKYLSLLLIFLALFSNCNSVSAINSKNNEVKNQSEPQGTYIVNTLYGKDVSEHKLTIIINSENRTMSGFSGCNTYSCNYTTEGKMFSPGFPMASKMYCEKTVELEKQFFKALSEMKNKDLKKNILTFKNEKEEEVIVAKKS